MARAQLCSRTPTIGAAVRLTFRRVNLAAILTASADFFGANTALKLDERELSYLSLDLASARLAGLLLARGVEAGERVGLMLPNVPEFAVAYYGVLRAGGVVVPMSVALAERELSFYLRDAEARLLLAWHGVAETAEAGARAAGADCLFVTPGELQKLLLRVAPERVPREREPSDPAVLLCSSGPSQLTHGGLTRDAREAIARHRLSETDVMLTGLPLFETSALNATVAVGACLTLMSGFDAGRALTIMERDRVTVFEGTPEMVSALGEHVPAGAELRLLYS
jgi:long-chain acyl-CoA synthetase